MDTTLTRRGDTLGATLLITGCCIGIGMIGLPVMSAMMGFIPATVALFLCYLFATGTGLLILEATLWFDKKVNLVSMADFALGKVGKAMTWFLFLFLFYCLFVAYIDSGGQLFANALSNIFRFSIPRQVGIAACVGFVALITYCGTTMVGYVSRIFLLGLAFSFCALLSFGIPHADSSKLLYTNWSLMSSAMPVLLICFGYQNLIPTLVDYVKRDVHSLRAAIFIGNLIPFVIYFLWNFVILGILPDGNSLALAQIISQSDMVTGLLEKASGSGSILFFAEVFSFFAILTPFMAATISFVDFFKDGLKRFKIAKHEILIYALVLMPPTILTFLFPHLFLKALGMAGGFADVILFGVLPVLIVGIGRYVKKIEGPFTAPGGKLLLVAILTFSMTMLLITYLTSS